MICLQLSGKMYQTATWKIIVWLFSGFQETKCKGITIKQLLTGYQFTEILCTSRVWGCMVWCTCSNYDASSLQILLVLMNSTELDSLFHVNP